jgi:signal transduction histidine kinase/CheY-like chemotaxis protein
MAAAAGFNSAIGMPIQMNGEFFGAIEFFSSSHIPEEPEIVRMFEAVGTEIGQFIQRQRIELEKERLLTQEMTLRQQAERASRLKDEFLATVSHELRTPLNSILGWAQIMRRESLDEEHRVAALETIFRNSQAQAQLIDDLLDMSRLITGNFPLNLVPASIPSIVEAAVEIVRPQAKAKSIDLVARFDQKDIEVTCDPERIQQVVWNLLVNALKFTPEAGRVSVGVNSSKDEVSISIRDNGEGIAPEFIPHVFDRFRQADSTSTRKHRGLGLGLAIVSNLTELHGGTVSVASEGFGKGAEFTVTLPITRSEPSEGAAAKNGESSGEFESSGLAPSPLENVRILIVEDDPDAADMLRYALRGAGADTKNAYSVSEAIDTLSVWEPSVVLSDITMPDEDGYSLIKRIRAMRSIEIAHVPAIALTAMARSEDGERALSSGFHMHMPKPVDIDELTKAISSLLDDHR